MKAPIRTAVALAACAWMAACAAPGLSTGAAISAQSSNAIAIGKSTKADVAAALGKGATVRFDSGFEVWVYRIAGGGNASSGNAEFVILFAPSGVVAKTRIRPAPPPVEARRT
jgi:hypothetical protein